jgi:hypothetical protein
VSPVTTRTPVERHADRGGDDLRHHRLGALALLGHADRRRHRAARVEPHRAAVLSRDRRAADAVEGGAGIGQLDEAGEADAAMDAARAVLHLLAAEGFVIHHR